MSRRSPRSLLAVAVLVAVVLGAAACSVGVGTPPEDYVPPDGASDATDDGSSAADVDLLVDGADDVVAAMADAVGTERVKALQLAIYVDSAYLEAQSPDDPSRVDTYNWYADEGVTSGRPKDVSDVDLDAQLFPLNGVDLDAIPGLVADAPALLDLHGELTTSVIVQRPAGSPTLITVFVSTPRGESGAVVADANGNVLSTS